MRVQPCVKSAGTLSAGSEWHFQSSASGSLPALAVPERTLGKKSRAGRSGLLVSGAVLAGLI